MFGCSLDSYLFLIEAFRGDSRVRQRSESIPSPGTAPGHGKLPAEPLAQPAPAGTVPPQPAPAETVSVPPASAKTAPAETALAQPAPAPAQTGPPQTGPGEEAARPRQDAPRPAGSPETEPAGAAEAPVGAPGDVPADPGDETVVMARIILPPAPPAPAPPPAGLPPAREPEADRKAELPSWPQVLATTIRLWTQRRLTPLRIAAIAAVVIVLAAAAITVTLVRNPAPAGPGQAGSGALGAAVTAREQAATWVARQVAADAIVACDPAMCSALQGKGVSASRLLVLQSGNADPLGSDVVMATAAVRNQFGNRLASVYAPEVLTSFGQGSAQVVIRAVAPDGAAAYRAALQADLQARTTVGLQLINNPRLQVSATARQQLAAGEVDARLLSALATLAALHPIYVAGFGGSAAHASAGVPLRTAEISGAVGGAGTRSTVSLGSLKAFLLAQRAPFLPAEMDIVRLATGQAVLRIEFAAPSPLGLLGPDS
jgi:hypothetical protein